MANYERDEADKALRLFTREHGMVYAIAKGVRKESSKLRYALNSYSQIRVEMVQARGGWRITGAELDQIFSDTYDAQQYLLIAEVFQFVDRLVQGEDPDAQLYDLMQRYLRFIRENIVSLSVLEWHWKIAILQVMGYLNLDQVDLALAIPLQELQVQSIENLTNQEQALRSIVERALEESQL